MAKPGATGNEKKGQQHRATSIGRSSNTRYKNKNDRLHKKKRYRGQGK